MTRIKKGLQN